VQLLSINVGQVRPLRVGERNLPSAIGKQSVAGAVNVGRLGLGGDTQADDSVHGGLSKAVYAYPIEHYALWQQLRLDHGVSLFDETLPHGFMGENLTLSGLLEHEVWAGDELHFPDCVLRVTEARSPCGKFAAIMGFEGAPKAMFEHGVCGFYLAVDVPGTLKAGQSFTLKPGSRSVSIVTSLQAKRYKHLR
jgi:MOSC domain-containing protein YiiM